TIAVRGKVVLLATEAPTGGINLWRIADGTIDRCEHLDGRMHFRPRFARDMHNVTWLFALDRGRRAMYYRRLLGGGFGTEQIAYGVQGRREHALEFSLPARLAGTQAGFPILHHADLPEGGAPQFRFDLLPVPQLAVTDSRRVLFLDLLEVAALD